MRINGYPDNETLAEITDAVRAVPGVDDAVAVVRASVSMAAAADASPSSLPMPELIDGEAAMADLDGGAVHYPPDAPRNLQEALRRAAATAPERGTIFIRQGRPDEMQAFPVLLDEAQQVLAGLRAAGLRPGDAALFIFADHRDYTTAFWACVLGGFVPTPVAVAPDYQAPNDMNRKLHNAWQLLGRPALLTDTATAIALADVRTLWDEPEVRVLTVAELVENPADTAWHEVTRETPVLNLLTSGSTGVPKCVQHTHASVTERSFADIQARDLDATNVSMTWMPLDHVSFVMYNVRDVFLGCLHVNATTDHFLADPLCWLDWIHRYRATDTWAPNFAFALVNEHAEQIRTRAAAWDLSCMRYFGDAAEPVIPATNHRFLQLLGPHGLREDAVCPMWGMAETCSVVTFTRQNRNNSDAGCVAVDITTLTGNIRVVEPGARNATVFSTVGPPMPGVRMRVLDSEGDVLPELRLGELMVAGKTMMREYFGNPKAQRESWDSAGWFRTGDLAFVYNGEVVIAGRKKDQIIVRGVNYLAHEIEDVVGRLDNVRTTFVAAAAVREQDEGSDRLAVFYVPLRWDADALAASASQVRAVLVREVGIKPDVLVPVTEAEFHKTGSGKIQRSAFVADLRAGVFGDRVLGALGGQPTDTWFARREWVEVPAAPSDCGAGATVVFAESDDLHRLAIDGQVVGVSRGTEWTEPTRDTFHVPSDDPAQLRRLLSLTMARHGTISTIVFAWPLSAAGDESARLTQVTAEFAALIGALSGAEFARSLVLVVTRGAVHADAGDTVDLGLCAIPALIRTVNAELPGHVVRQVDLSSNPDDDAQELRAEIVDRERGGSIAARQNRRWQPRVRPVIESDAVVESDATAEAPYLVVGGTYLITGGLGGLAHRVARDLLIRFGARLLLVGRSPAAGDKAERLAELTALGDVMYRQLDIADSDTMGQVVRAAEARWGRGLDGVFHLAAADPTGQWESLEQHTVVAESAAGFAEQYRAKVSGTLAIAEVLETRPAASLVLFGSVNGEFGGHGFGAYSAANSFLVGFADYWRHTRDRAVRCLAWSMWTDAGVNRSRSTGPLQGRGFRPLDSETGVRLLWDALAQPHHYVIIGLDFTHPIIVAEVTPELLRASEILIGYAGAVIAPDAVSAAVAGYAAAAVVPLRPVRMPNIPLHADGRVDTIRLLRAAAPDGDRQKSAPVVDGLERQIAALWSDALSKPDIGRDDSFFNLGGDSLCATRLLAMVDRQFEVRLSLQHLYAGPTVAAMAVTIAQRRTAAAV
ncbi:SDR family NAD(P)-dependent oxidoreductase [Nocardia sp. NPDC060256]|uniref:SDR family NAD(P)-dependent oxidoreductase n=1 Tax=unclassified Nocardia TaxID=2637762 RepID=UPI00365B3240